MRVYSICSNSSQEEQKPRLDRISLFCVLKNRESRLHLLYHFAAQGCAHLAFDGRIQNRRAAVFTLLVESFKIVQCGIVTIGTTVRINFNCRFLVLYGLTVCHKCR